MRPTRFTSKGSLEIIVHALIWLLVLILPLLSNERSGIPFSEHLRHLKLPLFFALVFYLNYVVLIHRLFFKKKFIAFIISNLILYAACITTLEVTRPTTFHEPFRHERSFPHPSKRDPNGPSKGPGPGRADMLARLLFSFALTTGLSVAIQVTKQWVRSEAVRKDLEGEHLKSELANLKNQLNPHFFFNTLNNIYSLIGQNQVKAQSAILTLSKLMRYLLYESNEQYVPLHKEVQFMHHYIDLMSLRVNNNVSVRPQFPKETGSLQIAPLLFISLIENSFKHGVSVNYPSEIEMTLLISQERKLTFKIRNTSFPKDDRDRSGSGIGLENLKKRLSLLYPEKHTLKIEPGIDYYTTVLTLQL